MAKGRSDYNTLITSAINNFYKKVQSKLEVGSNIIQDRNALYWSDARFLNHLKVVDYTRPTDKYPLWPLLYRICVNYPNSQSNWQFRLTVTDYELTQSDDYIASLINFKCANKHPSSIQFPYFRFHEITARDSLLVDYIWSRDAVRVYGEAVGGEYNVHEFA